MANAILMIIFRQTGRLGGVGVMIATFIVGLKVFG